jgi:hypothetical protein
MKEDEFAERLADLDQRFVNIAVTVSINNPESDSFEVARAALKLPADFVATRHQLAYDHRMQIWGDKQVSTCECCGTFIG